MGLDVLTTSGTNRNSSLLQYLTPLRLQQEILQPMSVPLENIIHRSKPKRRPQINRRHFAKYPNNFNLTKLVELQNSLLSS